MATCFSSLSNAQTVDSTGNLINNNNWLGVGAYAPDPNDCCSNPAGSAPLYDTTTNTIKWSYGFATVQQSIGIQSALSAAGTGLLVQGYNYSFDAKNVSPNGVGYDTFGYNTWLTNSAGQTLLNQGANLSTPFDWTTFSGSLSLNNGLPLPESGNVGISFYGRDDGYWAGLYGPEVRNVSLSLNYSFDPCAADPLYSSSCPGYFDAFLAKIGMALFGAPEPATVEVAPTPVVVTETAPVVESAPVASTTTQQTSTPTAEPESSSVATASASPTTTTVETTERSSRPGASLSTILGVLANEQSRLSSVERSTVEASTQQAAREAQSSVTQAESIASTASSASAESSSTASVASQASFSSSQGGADSALGSGIIVSAIQPLLNANQSFSETQSQSSSVSSGAVETTNETTSLTSVTSIEKLTENNMPQMDQTETQSNQSTVNRNAPNNEAAGAVTLASYTVAPVGFDAYLTALTDNPFYAPKEIYKNQKNVDNARLLRGLTSGSDRLHEQMVNEQYGR